MNASPTENGLNIAAISGTVATITGYLPTILAMIASIFTIIWLGLQIVMALQAQRDRRRTLRIQARSDTQAMDREDAIIAATPKPEHPEHPNGY